MLTAHIQRNRGTHTHTFLQYSIYPQVVRPALENTLDIVKFSHDTMNHEVFAVMLVSSPKIICTFFFNVTLNSISKAVPYMAHKTWKASINL